MMAEVRKSSHLHTVLLMAVVVVMLLLVLVVVRLVVAPDLSCVVANCEEVLWIERISIDSSHPAVVARFKDSENQSWKQACRGLKKNEKRLSRRRKPEVPGLACILHERTLPWAVPTLNNLIKRFSISYHYHVIESQV